MTQRFFICKHCGNIIAYVKNSGVPVACCGEKMTELSPCTTDASLEKHIPVYEIDGDGFVRVTVGQTLHPMIDEHYIEWVSLQTDRGNQRRELHPGDAPVACFRICPDEKIEAVYAYCNLHGLWKA